MQLEQFMLQFPTDVAPIVGQQVTLDATNAGVAGPRIDLLIARAGAPFDSLILGLGVNECDLVVKGTVAGSPRGWLYDGSEFVRLAVPRVDTRHTHGTGCTYSAAITALLARGETLVDAVDQAKDFISRAIASAPRLGHGHGPVNHWA